MRYSPERKEAVLKKMMPPHNRPIKQLAVEEGISEATLYNWRTEARAKGILMPDSDSGAEGWNARDKFAAVMETASLNEQEIAKYCRRKGIFPHQLKQWREVGMSRPLSGTKERMQRSLRTVTRCTRKPNSAAETGGAAQQGIGNQSKWSA